MTLFYLIIKMNSVRDDLDTVIDTLRDMKAREVITLRTNKKELRL